MRQPIRELNEIPLDKAVALYGAGRGGVRFLELLKIFRPELEIVCFIDSHKSGTVAGLEVKAFQSFLEDPSLYGHVTILVTSFYWQEIGANLEKNGITDYFVIPKGFFYPTQYNLKLTGAEREAIRPQLERVESLLISPEEKRLYRILTGEGMTFPSSFDAIGDYHYHRRTGNKQYFEFLRYDLVKTMVDGGVYDGLLLPRFLEQIKEKGIIYGFEPNFKNYSEGPFYKQLQANPRIKVFPQGLWSESCDIWLQDCRDASTVVPADHAESKNPTQPIVSIKGISIDDFVSKHHIEKVDLIKMDIEGAEIEALRGAQHTLITNRPQLAISIYHKKEDIYQIPLYLDKILKQYDYHIGHYTSGFCETVWYARPKEIQ